MRRVKAFRRPPVRGTVQPLIRLTSGVWRLNARLPRLEARKRHEATIASAKALASCPCASGDVA